MRILTSYLLVLQVLFASAQKENEKWIRAFPVTDYMIDLNDSVKLVQIELPEDLSFKNQQMGLLVGIYRSDDIDTVQKGYGRCMLIKNNYYYFAVYDNKSGIAIKEGDLMYTIMEPTEIYYGLIPKLAAHFIRLQNVYDENFYDRFAVFRNWSEEDEKTLIDSMIADIKFTGNYFLENDPSMNQEITKGDFKGNKVLEVMKECKSTYLKDFLNYMIIRPRLYAGKEWKLSEIFATWLVSGAPTVKD
jgi:hypothetical protein